MLERELVFQSQRRATKGAAMAARLQLGLPTQQLDNRSPEMFRRCSEAVEEFPIKGKLRNGSMNDQVFKTGKSYLFLVEKRGHVHVIQNGTDMGSVAGRTLHNTTDPVSCSASCFAIFSSFHSHQSGGSLQ